MFTKGTRELFACQPSGLTFALIDKDTAFRRLKALLPQPPAQVALCREGADEGRRSRRARNNSRRDTCFAKVLHGVSIVGRVELELLGSRNGSTPWIISVIGKLIGTRRRTSDFAEKADS